MFSFIFHMNETECRYDLVSHLLQHIWRLYRPRNRLFRRLLDLSAHQKLIQDEISLLKVKDNVQLTHLQDKIAQTEIGKTNKSESKE